MGQASIIMVVTLAIVFTIVSVNSDSRIKEVSNKSISYYSENVSQNICNSASEMLLTKLADNNDFREVDEISTSFLNGNITYTVIDTIVNVRDRIKISVIAYYNNEKANTILLVSLPEDGYIPPAAKAAASTNNDIQLLGSIVIDGRNHDKNGNLIEGGEGTFGVWTTGLLNQSGSSEIGGTNESTDYAPAAPADTNAFQSNQVFGGGYPDTPDKVMGGEENGFSEGYLKSVALSGSDGSQYVTDPTSLTYPLSGITYVEITDSWIDADITGSGILIVHNSSTNTIIKNPTGTFQGLVICDDIDKIHATIIGGLIGLTPTPASGNSIGNGDGSILYSTKAIRFASTKTNIIINDVVYFNSQHRLEINNWLE